MSKVFLSVAISLDGYLAPEGMALGHWDYPGSSVLAGPAATHLRYVRVQAVDTQ